MVSVKVKKPRSNRRCATFGRGRKRMAFRLKAGKPVNKGVKRIARREMDKALDLLGSKGGGDNSVHDARKAFKKVRSVLRLVRDEIGEKTFRRENRRFRDAARPLTEVRDAKALVEALDKLAERSAHEAKANFFAAVRKSLQADRRAIRRRVLKDDRAIPGVLSEVKAGRGRLRDWSIPHKGWSGLSGGLRETYKVGRRAFAAAQKDANPEALHEWRKQAKYLWHQLQLLAPMWPGVMEELAEEIHTLTDLLGDDHDLVVLRERLTTSPDEFGGPARLPRLFDVIDGRRRELADQALALGRRLYADRPKDFTGRLRDYWRAWRANPEVALQS
jgi:CHAD domain-containing protein